ncbi:hypothetical protein [Lentzea aerocolonigenes]|uniref:hypothetical protein n=1 Tax=Lentzea aerocolonigenes TaxID=68170 RepID=UPI000AA5B61C|nr:hypothetical protein [Lentzea aerocolonigenes]
MRRKVVCAPTRRVFLLVVAMLTALVVVPDVQMARADAAGIGGDYVPLAAPFRVVDTTKGTGGVTGPRGPGSTTVFSVLGSGGIPATGVTAVLADIAPVFPTASTWLQVWEDGTPRSSSSTVNIPASGAALSNSAVVPVSPAGKIDVYNNSGNVHVTIDVHGYFTSVPGGTGRGGFVPATHTKILDTYLGIGTPKAAIPANGSLTVQITGGVIPAGANAAFLDVLVFSATKPGWLGVLPSNSSVLDYPVGATATGAAVKLDGAGRAVFRNNGAAPIHLQLVAQGYFTADSATGAGLRKASGRLAGGLSVAANSTVDVAVGGRFGLPTRSIAGAAINLTTLSQSKPGYLKAWPLGEPEPDASLANYSPGVPRADQAIVKTGTEGKIRIKNVGAASVTLYVDLQAWFADPLPSLQIEQNSRVSVFQPAKESGAQFAPVEYAYVNNLGQLMHGHQTQIDQFDRIQWTTVSGNEAFTGQPSLAQSADGKLQLTAQNTDSGIWSLTSQKAPNGDPVDWAPWTRLGGSMSSAPVAGKLPDGSLARFAVDSDGRLWQLTSEPSWTSLGDADLAGTPTVVTIRDGLQLFALNTTGTLLTAIYRDGALSGWTSLGGTGLTGSPAVIVTPGFRARVVVRSADGTLVTKLQEVSGTFPTAWESVGDFVAVGSPAVVISPVTGKTEMFARGADNEIYLTDETTQGAGTWTPWSLLRGNTNPPTTNPDPSATDPSVFNFTNVNGNGFAVIFRNRNNVLRWYAIYTNGAAKSTAHSVALPK